MLNDFEAVGYGIPALGRDDLVSLNPKATPVPMVRLDFAGAACLEGLVLFVV